MLGGNSGEIDDSGNSNIDGSLTMAIVAIMMTVTIAIVATTVQYMTVYVTLNHSNDGE